MDYLPDFLKRLADEDAVVVSIASTQGSVPREAGTWMAVFASTTIGSIGGGHLEWQATGQAREMLVGQPVERVLRYALGPSLGQCCGGEVTLQFEPVSAPDIPRLPTCVGCRSPP